jgi:hypothetical protein
MLAQEVQLTIFNFCLALKQKELSAHIENTPNRENSIKTEPNSVNIGPI